MSLTVMPTVGTRLPGRHCGCGPQRGHCPQPHPAGQHSEAPGPARQAQQPQVRAVRPRVVGRQRYGFCPPRLTLCVTCPLLWTSAPPSPCVHMQPLHTPHTHTQLRSHATTAHTAHAYTTTAHTRTHCTHLTRSHLPHLVAPALPRLHFHPMCPGLPVAVSTPPPWTATSGLCTKGTA